MKRSRFTETQIVKAIQEHENGRDAKDICRELGITTGYKGNISHICVVNSLSANERLNTSNGIKTRADYFTVLFLLFIKFWIF